MKRKGLSFLLSTSGTKNLIPVDKNNPFLRAEIAVSDEKGYSVKTNGTKTVPTFFTYCAYFLS